jgi:branched-chain amino acid transport system ATP-binding protein
MNNSKTLLELESLTKQFGELTVLDGIDLTINEGEIHSIIGPNGAGKTTLFNTITGKFNQSSGDILFDGSTITNRSMSERAQLGITRSYQENNLFLEETVLENIRLAVQTRDLGLFSGKMFGNGREYNASEAREIVQVLGLEDKMEMNASVLSHGHQRLLGIGIAVGTDPDLLLLDEPTSGMDAESTQETKELIENLHETFGMTIVLIEHDLDIVLDVSDKITVLNRGKRIVTGEPATVQDNTRVQDVYLGGTQNLEVT